MSTQPPAPPAPEQASAHVGGPQRLRNTLVAALVIGGLVLVAVMYGLWNRPGENEQPVPAPTQTESPDQPTRVESEIVTEDPADQPDAITHVDLGNQEWTFRLRDEEYVLPFIDGQYADNGQYHWSLDDEMTVYSDANQDGYLDAATVVSKYSIGGNGWERFVVLWRWNPQTQQAEIIPDVVGYFVRCYGTLDSLQAVKGGFRFSGIVVPDDSVDSSCAQPRGEHYSRTVAIDGLDPIRIDATSGWGGICGRGIGDAGVGQMVSDVADEFKVAARTSAPDITLKVDHFGQANGHPIDKAAGHYYRGDYVLIYYYPHDVDFEHLGETPCGWAKLKPGEPRG